ncbi:uncharacterized protein LOC124532629 [Vanessa cardui]|uniref:uncharacterized protein LOC124532629 n=1 Tax=Vanessa cardui TaxID=171605 RepID=UPI001F1426B6|nr:uncharacterized protein LOC124532629 [Vanessa cardui]
MAGNKINTKKKEDKNKANRLSGQSIEENEETDFSLLRKPIQTNITGFSQARKIFDQATEELKSLLTNECDLLYECKVCRNIFRSLANFISHKRVYCKEKFNSSIHGHFFKETCSIQEVLKIRKLEESYQESLKDINDSNSIKDDDCDKRIPISKDITEVVERIVKHKGVQEEKLQEQQLVFQKIPKSSVAVYQNIAGIDDETSSDSMQLQVKELDNILSQENAILQSDGTFKVQSNNNVSSNVDNVIQISDDEENEDMDELKCRICDLQFSTQKTLKFHMKYKHLESRLVYPCPDCLDIFSTSWSVYRHLFKVHRKTAAQIRRLRESIQAKAFRMNNPPAFYEKRKTIPKNVAPQKITEEERLDQENQAWLEQLDGEGDGRRCGGCGRTFERRAALAAHAHTCARRHRRRIQIQIRKDYDKTQHNPYLPQPRIASVADSATVVEDVEIEEKTEENVKIEVKDKNEEKEKYENKDEQEEKDRNDEKDKNELKMKKDKDEDQLTEAVMTIIEEKREQDDDTKEMEIDNTTVQNIPFFYDSTLMNKLPFAQQAEKSNLNALKQKMQIDTDIDQLLCKKCSNKFNEFLDLFDHMGAHYKWVRYACKLCNFKHFNFDNLLEHVKVVHKLKGNTDFYYSTVKAIDGAEALELAETTDDVIVANEISPDSRRPSRCSSDSSRISDDSSSSSTRVVEVGSRKRKANRYKNNLKKKKETFISDDVDDQKADESLKEVIVIENDSPSNPKIFEENSSDMDELDEKTTKRHQIELATVTSRRPVRKKTKPKNEDFEYDLSNLLKLEAQGYRDYQPVTSKPAQSKKKIQQDVQNNYDLINKDCCGALTTLSRKSVENAQSHMKTLDLFNNPKETRSSSVFARPMIPKVTRSDKISPKKEEKELKDTPIVNKVLETCNLPSLTKVVPDNEIPSTDSLNKKSKTGEPEISKELQDTSIKVYSNDTIKVDSNKEEVKDKLRAETIKVAGVPVIDSAKPNLNVPMVPIKFRRQSLEVIKNPLIKKNITDFTKAGMKTKILVIKPINRNSDGTQALNSPLKFQTIKLKDPNKSIALNEDKKDQVVVVKVPKVDCNVTKTIASNIIVNNVSPASVEEIKSPVGDEEIILDTTSSENDEGVLEDNVNTCKEIDCEPTPHVSVIKTTEMIINNDTTANV